MKLSDKRQDALEARVRRGLEALDESDAGRRARQALAGLVPDVTSVYVLRHVIGQGEDAFTLLVNGDQVVSFELERAPRSLAISEVGVLPVADYRHSLGGNHLAELDLAIARSGLGRG